MIEALHACVPAWAVLLGVGALAITNTYVYWRTFYKHA